MKQPLLLGALFVAATSLAEIPRVLHSTLQNSNTSIVPGLNNTRWGSSNASFGRIFASPNGNRYAFMGLISGGRAIIRGEYATTVVASLVIASGNNTVWPLNNSELCIDLRTTLGINDAGQIGLNATNNSAATSNEHVLLWSGGNFFEVAREGTLSPQLGSAYLTALTSAQVDASGGVAFGSGINSSANAGGLFSFGSLIAQRNVTTPAGQLTSTIQPITFFETDRFRVGQFSGNTIYNARVGTNTAVDSVVVVDSTVVAQEGFPIPGITDARSVGSFDVPAISSSAISPRNGWYGFRGAFADGKDFLVLGRSGGTKRAILEDSPITGSGTETWSSTGTALSMVAVNSFGESVRAGQTNDPDGTKNFVVVFDNGYFSEVVLRRSDALDLNGDGLDNDNLAFQTVSSDNAALGDNNRLYMGVNMRNSAGTITGISVVVMDLPLTGDVDGSGEVDAADIDFVIANFGGGAGDADVDGSGEVDAADIDIVIANFGRTR